MKAIANSWSLEKKKKEEESGSAVCVVYGHGLGIDLNEKILDRYRIDK
jgi:hypothetical protein